MRTAHEVAQLIHDGTSFDSMLFRLMNHADSNNRRKLWAAFPHQAREYINWFNHGPLE